MKVLLCKLAQSDEAVLRFAKAAVTKFFGSLVSMELQGEGVEMPPCEEDKAKDVLWFAVYVTVDVDDTGKAKAKAWARGWLDREQGARLW